MRSWLTYIFLLMVACGTVLTSCSDVLSEEGLGTCDDRTTVRLTISFGGDDDPMSRDVGSDQTPKDDDLDYTTEAQAEIVTGDVYALVVDAISNKFLYRIKDLHLEEPDNYDNYYTRTLEGTMIQTNGNDKVKIVLLANLIQNNIDLGDFNTIEAFIDSYETEPISNLYKQLIYNYDGATTPWTVTGNEARRIPMWGQSIDTTVPAAGVTLGCYLYRAVAKVQIWVNMKKGIAGTTDPDSTEDDFKITKITVQNANNQGYCVSLLTPNTSETVQYTAPSIPNYTSQNVVYSTFIDDQDTKAFSDMIYLPEQSNTATGSTPVKLLVEYTYNGVSYTGDKAGVIEFKDSDTGHFDVVRNHSYIFNINKVSEVTGKIYYVVDQWDNETIDIPPFK